MAYSKICNNQYRIARINKNGYREEIIYTGSLRDKPKGWRVVQVISINGKLPRVR